MKVEFRNKKEKTEYHYKDIPSGTTIVYGDKENSIKSIGILLRDVDECNDIIYDLEDNVYYSDVEKYYIFETIDEFNTKFVIE